MSHRRRAREMSTVLDKARELSRHEPAADWSDAEWKGLMATAVSQEIERKPGRGEAGTVLAGRRATWKPILAYGTVALVLVAVLGITLKRTLLKSAAPPTSQAPVLAQKPNLPRLRAIEAPPSEAPEVIAQAPALASKPVPAAVRPRKSTRLVVHPQPSAPPLEEVPQDVVTVKLVSPDTGLQIVWVLNRNFEWKGEGQ